MKKLILVLALLVTSPVWAAEKSAATSDGDSVNIRFSPLSVLVGAQVEADFAVHPDWTIGPTLSVIHFKTPSGTSAFPTDFEINGYDIGARANWFNNGVFNSGLYVAPMVHYASVNLTTKDSSGASVTGSASPLLATVLVGYGWFWNTFNIMLGGGETIPLGSYKVTVTDSNGRQSESNANLTGLALEFTLGWKF